MKRNKWSDDEINIIKKNYKNLSDEELHKLIPRHPLSSISTKRKDMGLTRPVWNKKYSFVDLKNEMDKKSYALLSSEADFSNAGSIIKYRCPKHPQCVQETTLGRLLEGKGCMYCGRERTRDAELISTERCRKICNERGFIFVDNYVVGRCMNVFFICPKHKNIGVQRMTYQNMKRDGYGCKYCRSSLTACSNGEKRIKDFLERLQIKFIQQYRFDDCRDQNVLPFDFYLPDSKVIIEFDGRHHFEPVTFNGVSHERALYLYQKTVEHDKIKDDYCKIHGIKLIRIPYWNQDEIDVILIDNFAKYKIIEKIA